MPNRQLTTDELERGNDFLAELRIKLERLAIGDTELLFAYRRKVAKVTPSPDRPRLHTSVGDKASESRR
jgi:hypothetical protein